jgi:UDP-N-acetylglucosamine enolpyruvyl transferase
MDGFQDDLQRHLWALERLGAQIKKDEDYYIYRHSKQLRKNRQDRS